MGYHQEYQNTYHERSRRIGETESDRKITWKNGQKLSIFNKINEQIKEAQQIPTAANSLTPTLIKIKLSVGKDRENLPSNKRKSIYHIQEILNNTISWLSAEILQARMWLDNIFKVLKERTHQMKILYLSKFILQKWGWNQGIPR